MQKCWNKLQKIESKNCAIQIPIFTSKIMVIKTASWPDSLNLSWNNWCDSIKQTGLLRDTCHICWTKIYTSTFVFAMTSPANTVTIRAYKIPLICVYFTSSSVHNFCFCVAVLSVELFFFSHSSLWWHSSSHKGDRPTFVDEMSILLK